MRAYYSASRFYSVPPNSVLAGSGRGEGSAVTLNFTGGRSLNRKSHFHRSDGLETWSQDRAATGGRKTRSAMAEEPGTSDMRAAMSDRTWAALVYENATPRLMPRLTRICQSSIASVGGAITRA